MSKEHATRSHTIATEIGVVVVQETLISEHDVEDIVRNKAISQARSMQMVNLAQELDGNIQPSQGVVPSKLRTEV